MIDALLDRLKAHSGRKAETVNWAEELRGRGLEPELIARVETGDDDRACAACVCWLAELAGRESVPLFRRWLNHPLPHVRYEAIAALGCVGAAVAADDLRALAMDPDPQVQRLAAYNLKRITSMTDLAAVRTAAASDANQFERERALRILGEADSGGSVELFTAALSDPSPAVRAQACRCLEDNGCAAHRALRALRALAIDALQPVYVRQAAALAIDAADEFEKNGRC